MDAINLAKTLIGREVERLFNESPARYGENCRNPVTGAGYVHGVDPIAEQKEAAYRVLLAREWFAFNAPPDAPPLPINGREREDWRQTSRPLDYIVALYARSFADRCDVKEHPSFADYVSGVLWDNENARVGGRLPDWPDGLPQLKKRFPPRELAGMELGFCWRPPKPRPKKIASYRRGKNCTA